MIRLLSLFTGIGAFEKALERLNIPYELVGFSEIDNFAVQSYCAIHNVSENKNLGDIKNIDISSIPDFDLMTWGFPCQDISISGKMQGIKENQTRSGLYYEGYKILKAKLPKYSVIENVKNLISKRFKTQFDSILNDLEKLGYKNQWAILNSKDYGIPQNRERVFIVSIREDLSKSNFSFPPKVNLLWKLKDFLEDVVDDKYYLTEKGIGRLIKRQNKLLKQGKNSDVCSCIVADYYKQSARDNEFIAEKNKIKRIGGLYDKDDNRTQAGSIYDVEGLSPTLTTMTNGGNKKPFILVNEGTQKGYTEATDGDSINISYPCNTKKRGRVGKEISQTLVSSPSMAVVENYNDRKMFNIYNQKEIKDIAPTQTSTCGIMTSSSAVLISEGGKEYMRIRRLTPLECFRLMGFDDIDFYYAKSTGLSDSQLYKQAGNSIVVDVLEAIFKNLLCDEIKEEIA